jgi:hypothetical protein
MTEGISVHAHARSGDPSSFVINHVERLQSLEDKVSLHDTNFTAQGKIVNELSTSLKGINSNISAVKWLAIGCVVMLMLNTFGFIQTVKMWFGLHG